MTSGVVDRVRARRAERRRGEALRKILARCGTWAPRPLASNHTSADEREPTVQLRMELEILGPGFQHFSLYLSSRIDLLTEAECQELARTRARTEIMDPP